MTARRRGDLFSHGWPGILGVFPSNPEIIAVYPELSSTLVPHTQEIRLRRGDSIDVAIQVQDDDDPSDPVQIDNGVLRWAAKQGFGETERDGVTIGNAGALVIKRSYDRAEIEFGGGRGRAILHLLRDDTVNLPLSPALWDLELTIPTESIVVPEDAVCFGGPGSDTLLVQGANLEKLGVGNGHLILFQERLVLVTERISPVHLRVDFDAWSPGSGPFSIQRGNTRTIASGPFVVEGDVIL